jgi:hypothetical protein
VAPKKVDRFDETVHKVVVNGLATWFGVKPMVARKLYCDASFVRVREYCHVYRNLPQLDSPRLFMSPEKFPKGMFWE